MQVASREATVARIARAPSAQLFAARPQVPPPFVLIGHAASFTPY